MTKKNIVRAWKDPEYRSQLSEAERAALPELPVGIHEIDETLLRPVGAAAAAAASSGYVCTISGEITGFSCNPLHWFD
jgi:mersacidin/lichenicidin family type 2 lantibiotic